ncbi:MAG: dTDP-4-dehydrorhamnose 3,5-epimerase [Deltaproteobacteria bacterium]|nr:dTDP-4-dehydrorhamnose 3,5-epimerase [Deltaproteobacteria bacterium]
MRFLPTQLPGVLVIEPDRFDDGRGFFLETYHRRKFEEGGVREVFVQDNHSRSLRGVLRGLHFQTGRPQGKLVRVVRGEVFDVAVDLRRGSPTFGRWHAVVLGGESQRMLYVPPGLAHGFCVLSEEADFLYKCTDFYAPEGDRGVRWNDPDLGIDWPLESPILSEKDARLPLLRDVPREELAAWEGG